MEQEIEKHYCGDCIFLRLKRTKDGRLSGEHICVKWDGLRSECMPVVSCSFFFDKAGYRLPEPPQGKVEAICRELFDIWKEAKSDLPDGDNWNDGTWDTLPEKHQAEYIKTAKRIALLSTELTLISDEEMERCRTFGINSEPISMGHVEWICQKQVSDCQAQLDSIRGK